MAVRPAKDWRDFLAGGTALDAPALEDLESRAFSYSEDLVAEQALAVVDLGTVTTNQSFSMSTHLSALVSATLGASGLTFEITGWAPGKSAMLVLKQDGTGGRTVAALPSAKWEGGLFPAGSTAPNLIDVRSFVAVSASLVLGFETATGMA